MPIGKPKDKNIVTSVQSNISSNRSSQISYYLKHVPENFEEKTVRYSLQGRLLEIDMDVDVYIKSLESVQFFKPSLRPSQLLLSTFSRTPYIQCNIDLFFNIRGTTLAKISQIWSFGNICRCCRSKRWKWIRGKRTGRTTKSPTFNVEEAAKKVWRLFTTISRIFYVLIREL